MWCATDCDGRHGCNCQTAKATAQVERRKVDRESPPDKPNKANLDACLAGIRWHCKMLMSDSVMDQITFDEYLEINRAFATILKIVNNHDGEGGL